MRSELRTPVAEPGHRPGMRWLPLAAAFLLALGSLAFAVSLARAAEAELGAPEPGPVAGLVAGSGMALTGLLLWLGFLYHRARIDRCRVLAAAAAESRETAQRHRAEDRFDRFLEISLELVAIGGFDGQVHELSAAWETTLGWSREEIMARPFHELIHPRDRPRVRRAASHLADGRTVQDLEIRCRCRDGSYRWLRWRSASDPSEGLVYGVARDVTEEKRMHRELRQAQDRLRHGQKMEAMGRLAGGIAHDFNNLLMVISGCAENILGGLPEDSSLRKYAREVQKTADRGADLTGQLLLFSRRGHLQPQPLDLNAVLRDLESMLRHLLEEQVELHTWHAPAIGPVQADPGQLQQVILNLVINARDAMPEGGTITLETSEVSFEAGEAASRQLEPGRYASLAVTDTGCGMDEEVRERIFEPFFTTKEEGSGTGLGLSTVYGIVQQGGGSVEVATEPGQGTTFTVYLPVVETQPVEAERLAGGGPQPEFACGGSAGSVPTPYR